MFTYVSDAATLPVPPHQSLDLEGTEGGTSQEMTARPTSLPALPHVETSLLDTAAAKSHEGSPKTRTIRSKKCGLLKKSEKEYPMADVARQYERGKPMVDSPAQLGIACRRLHKYYLDVSNRPFPNNVMSLVVHFAEEHFKHGAAMFTVEFQDLFDMFHFRELDASILRCFTL